MLANLMHGDAALFRWMAAQTHSGVNLFAKNSLEPIRQRLAQFQAISHSCSLLVGQSHVAITFFARHLPPKPGRGLELPARCTVGEFHLCHYQTGMSAPISINLDK